MKDRLQSALARTASSTFEELGFVFPEGDLRDDQADARLTWTARVAFVGPLRGELEIRVSDDVVSEVAANMTGVFERVPTDLKRDALGEVANVICGNLVPYLDTPEAEFNLGAPFVTETTGSSEASGRRANASLVVGIEDGRAEIDLYILADDREGAPA